MKQMDNMNKDVRAGKEKGIGNDAKGHSKIYERRK